MSSVEFAGRIYDCRETIQRLSSQLSAERLARIHKIVGQRSRHLVTILENIYDQGNARAVMRSAEAFGFHEVHHIITIKQSKESKRVSMGAEKWMTQRKWRSSDECVRHLRQQGYRIFVTQLEGGRPFYECDLSTPFALAFGGERKGVSPALREAADERVFLPMHGFVESFNISVAAALCYQTTNRSLLASLGHLPPLSEEEKTYLVALYLLRSVGHPPYTPGASS